MGEPFVSNSVSKYPEEVWNPPIDSSTCALILTQQLGLYLGKCLRYGSRADPTG